jgi:hypothetical protein
VGVKKYYSLVTRPKTLYISSLNCRPTFQSHNQSFYKPVIHPAFGHPVIQSSHHCVVLSFGHAVFKSLSFGHAVIKSLSFGHLSFFQCVIRSPYLSISLLFGLRSCCHLVNLSFGHPIILPPCHSVTLLFCHPVILSPYYSVTLSFGRAVI